MSAKDVLDGFDCWFMYLPPGDGSIAVPLRKLDWYWQFNATKTNNIWSVFNKNAQWGMYEQYPSHPLWSLRVFNAGYKYIGTSGGSPD